MRRVMCAVAAGAVAVPLLAAPASAKTIGPEFFGLHVSNIANAPPSISVGAVRLWDSGVRWDQIEAKQGKYNWGALDRRGGFRRGSGGQGDPVRAGIHTAAGPPAR